MESHTLTNRGWINALFWFVWASSGVAALLFGSRFDSVVSILLGSAGLWVNLYPRFVQGAKAKCLISQITILEVAAGNQSSVLADIAIQDVLSDCPSPEARRLINGNRIVQTAASTKAGKDLRTLFAQSPPPNHGYLPNDELIRPWLIDPRATPAFFVPVFIYNSGAKYADIGSIVMVAERTEDRSKQWVFAAYFELDEAKLIRIHEPTKDVEKFARFFAGAAIPPNGSIKLNLHFVPHPAADGVRLSTSNLVPGKYDLRFTGFAPNGNQVFETAVREYPLAEETLLCCFKDGQWTYTVGLESNILKLLNT